ncbi:hypothetical protein AZF01_07290 [Martelella sp. AD-3]|nr:hypothetical protein AZF01_07290 [Martelella sp. AD-3]MAM12034.1 hypothetical protein [Rhizobiaceae bacterium]
MKISAAAERDVAGGFSDQTQPALEIAAAVKPVLAAFDQYDSGLPGRKPHPTRFGFNGRT